MTHVTWSEIGRWVARSVSPFPVNQRNAPRLQSRNLVRFLRSDDMPQETMSNLLDLSATGLRFACNHKLSIGMILNLVINLPERKHQIPALGRVVWCRKGDGRVPVYLIGITYVDMNDTDRRSLESYVRHRL